MEHNPALDQLVSKVKELPGIPDITLKVIRLTDDARASASDVAKVLSEDQTLTARVLRLVNSAAYGGARQVSTVTEATVRLGMRNIRTLAYAASCQDMLASPLDGYALTHGELWRHSYACALAARTVAVACGHKRSEEAFVAGLLHDIGKVLLDTQMKSAYRQVAAIAETDSIPFMDAERKEFGFDHAQAGALLLQYWSLPDILVKAVGSHYTPLTQLPFDPLTGIVHVADIISIMLGIGLGTDGLDYPLESQVLDKLGLSDGDFEAILGDTSDLVTAEGLVSSYLS